MRQKAKPLLIVIALDYGKTNMDPEKVREFWSRYMEVLPVTGIEGTDEAKYIASGVSVYGDKEIPQWP